MSLVDVGLPWRRQPQPLARVNWDNPFAEGLVDVVIGTPGGLYSVRTGLMAADLGSTKVGSFVGSPGYGRHSKATSSSSYEDLPTPQLATAFSAVPGMTLYAFAQCGASVGGNGSLNLSSTRHILGLYITSTVGFGIGCDATTGQISAAASLSASRDTTALTVGTVAPFHAFAMAQASAGLILDVPGIGTTAASSTWTADATAPSSPKLRTGYDGSTSAPGDKILYFGALWARVLSAEKRQQIAADPWQLVEPQRIWVPVATGGGGVTGTSAAQIDLAATSAGAVLVGGDSSVNVTLGATSSGGVAVVGESSQQIDLTGTATGVTTDSVTGASDQTVTLTGGAAGTVAVAGASSQQIDLAPTSAGGVTVVGQSTGTIDLGAQSTGTNGSGVAVTAGGDDDSSYPTRRRKYVVQDGTRLLAFDSQRAAQEAEKRIAEARQQAQQAIAKASSKSQARKASSRRADIVRQAIASLPAPPVDQVDLRQVQAGAAGFAQMQAALQAAKEAADATAIYAVWQVIQQDEEDIQAAMEAAHQADAEIVAQARALMAQFAQALKAIA